MHDMTERLTSGAHRFALHVLPRSAKRTQSAPKREPLRERIIMNFTFTKLGKKRILDAREKEALSRRRENVLLRTSRTGKFNGWRESVAIVLDGVITFEHTTRTRSLLRSLHT